MYRYFIPSKDADFLAWSEVFAGVISASPSTYNVSVPVATALSGYQVEYASTLAASTNPATRGTSTRIAKDAAKKQLREECQKIARIVQAVIGITEQQLHDLGLTVRKTTRTPKPVPSYAPTQEIEGVLGRRVKLRLRHGATGRGIPADVESATVLTFVGEEAPDETGNWKLEGSTTRAIFEIEFPADLPPGATVWITSYYVNSRGESGPACTATSVTFGAAQVNNNGTLRLAA